MWLQMIFTWELCLMSPSHSTVFWAGKICLTPTGPVRSGAPVRVWGSLASIKHSVHPQQGGGLWHEPFWLPPQHSYHHQAQCVLASPGHRMNWQHVLPTNHSWAAGSSQVYQYHIESMKVPFSQSYLKPLCLNQLEKVPEPIHIWGRAAPLSPLLGQPADIVPR